MAWIFVLMFVLGTVRLWAQGNTPEESSDELQDTGRVAVHAGRYAAEFTPEHGFRILVDGIPVIERTEYSVVNPAWRIAVSRSWEANTSTTRSFAADSSTLTVHYNGSSDFAADEAVTVAPDGARLSFAYKYVGTAPANMNLCLGWLATNPIKGLAFNAVTPSGLVNGVLPAGISEYQQSTDLPLQLLRLKTASRLGDYLLDVTRGSALILKQLQRGTNARHAGSLVYWLGLDNLPLKPGDTGQYEYVVRIGTGPTDLIRAVPRDDKPTAPRLSPIVDALSPLPGPSPVIPQPQYTEARSGVFPVRPGTRIILSARATAAVRLGVDQLNHDLQVHVGYMLPVVVERPDTDPANAIVVGDPFTAPLVRRLCTEELLDVGPYTPGPEGYVLSARPDRCLIAGSDAAGTYYGLQTAAQLIQPQPDASMGIACQLIRDWPDFHFRGVHLLADDAALSLDSKLIRDLFSRLKLNEIVFECEYGRWKSHPEIVQPWSMSLSDMRALKQVAEAHLMRVTPLLQSLGHCEWLFANGANRDIVEDPSHPYAYCPSNPRSYKVLFDILDEVLDVFHPDMVHIGHDEVGNRGRFGVCPLCLGKSPVQLFANDVRTIHNYLARRGVKTMMWGDMLLRPDEAQDAASGGPPYDIAAARNLLPRDIIVADWHYNQYRDYRSVGLFRRAGFDVIGATWYNEKNIYYFARSAKVYGALGMLQTTWTGHGSNKDALRLHPAQIQAYITAAEYWWSAGRPPIDDLPYRAGDVLYERLHPRRMVRYSMPGFVADLSPLCNISLSDNDQPGGWIGCGRMHDLRRLPTGSPQFGLAHYVIAPRRANGDRSAIMLAGTYTQPGDFPTAVTIPIGRAVESLYLLQTCAWPVPRGVRVGAYKILYADGETAEIPLEYAENILAWDDDTLNYTDGRVWRGKTLSGADVSITSLVWDNPRPQVPVRSIEFSGAGTEASPVLLAVTGLNPSPQP